MKTRVRLRFPQERIKEPVLFTMAKKYDLMPNIRRARVTEDFGEMLLELDGQDDNIKNGLASLRRKGVEVELIEGDVIE